MYSWLREAFVEIYKLFDGLAKKGLILLGHVKQASINKAGKELGAKDIALTGKLKLIVSADCDAIGYLYRSKENMNEVWVSFVTNELDLATGARPAHLRNQEFMISKFNEETGKFEYHWNKIFREEEDGEK